LNEAAAPAMATVSKTRTIMDPFNGTCPLPGRSLILGALDIGCPRMLDGRQVRVAPVAVAGRVHRLHGRLVPADALRRDTAPIAVALEVRLLRLLMRAILLGDPVEPRCPGIAGGGILGLRRVAVCQPPGRGACAKRRGGQE